MAYRQAIAASRPITEDRCQCKIYAVNVNGHASYFKRASALNRFAVEGYLSGECFRRFIPCYFLGIHAGGRGQRVGLFALSNGGLIRLPYYFLGCFQYACLGFKARRPFRSPICVVAVFFCLPIAWAGFIAGQAR